MCETPDPAKIKDTGSHDAPVQERREVDQNQVDALMARMVSDDMDESTRMALRAAIEDDIATGMYDQDMNDEQDGIPIEQLLERLDQPGQEEQRKLICREFNLAETATTDELRQAIITASTDGTHNGGNGQIPQDQIPMADLIADLSSDPAIAAQLAQLIPPEARDDPQAMQLALEQLAGLLQGAHMGDEDDEFDYDEAGLDEDEAM